jgi:glycosyltransferase involved in cell wall biosynthesis
MRIGVDARTLTLPEIRGMAAYVLDLLKVWPNSEDRFLLFAENPPRSEALDCPAAVSWRRVPSPRGSRFQVWDWCALPRAVRRERPDLLWSPANRAFPVPGIPQVVTVHDTLLQEKVAFADPVEGAYFRRITPLFLRGFADGIVTVSHFSAERIARVMGYPEQRIRVIHNGISPPDRPFESRKAALRFLAERGIVDRDFIYALGAESPWKNTRGLLAAFREVSRRTPDAFLVVGGIQARAFDEFQGHCRALGIDGSVKLTGFVSREIRDALYRAARLFVYPSLF